MTVRYFQSLMLSLISVVISFGVQNPFILIRKIERVFHYNICLFKLYATHMNSKMLIEYCNYQNARLQRSTWDSEATMGDTTSHWTPDIRQTT